MLSLRGAGSFLFGQSQASPFPPDSGLYAELS